MTTQQIIDIVRDNGDDVLAFFNKQYDEYEGPLECDTQAEVSNELAEAIHGAIVKIRDYQRYIRPIPRRFERDGLTVELTLEPIRKIGIYIPKGYVSTVIHTVVPAQVAGCKDITICTPPPVSDAILFACHVLGIDKVYCVGGPAAIAAMAYGTETVPEVYKIVGPGSFRVQNAKKAVSGDVGIDMIAAMSEILQLGEHYELSEDAVREHGDGGFVSWNVPYAGAWREGEREPHETVEVWGDAKIPDNEFGAICKDTPHAYLDYCAGPSHVLPTRHCCEWASGLSVYDFIRFVPIVTATANRLEQDAHIVKELALAEGFPKHWESVEAKIR